MKIFIDANVFLDILQKRRGWESSFAIRKGVVEGVYEGYISALSVAVIYFLRLSRTDYKTARLETQKIRRGFKLIDLTDSLIQRAFEEERIEDLEDAIQFHSAKEAAKVFITRNKRHFEKVKDEIEVLTPEESLKRYKA